MTHSTERFRPLTDEEIVKAVQGMTVTSSAGVVLPSAEQGWLRVAKRLGRPALRRRPVRFRWNLGALAAASVLLVGVAGLVWNWSNARHSVESQSFVTGRGEQSSLQLPDGSYAVLAPRTTLTYHGDAKGNRIVTLKGQAYFAIQHDPARPFAVQANGVTTRVLGTAFTVRAYSSDTRLEVAVSEGRVAVEVAQDSAVLLPGDVGYITGQNAIEISKHEKIADVFGWMRGEVAFRDAPVQEVVAELERRYDVSVLVADSELGQRPVTIVFSGESVQTLITSIALASGASAVWTDSRSVTLAIPR